MKISWTASNRSKGNRLQHRIFGTESEYAPFDRDQTATPQAPLSNRGWSENQAKMGAILIESLQGCRCPLAGEFLGNGGRLYLDRGGHPEYATPECRTVKDLVAHEKAGDVLIQALVEKVRSQHPYTGLHVYKNNCDSYGHTYGGHENYLVTSLAMKHLDRLVPFLVTRQIYTGTGKVMTSPVNGCPVFQISQRADFFDATFSDRTSETRGIINIRKREIARPGENQRLHIIVGDSNMAQPALALKIGVTALVLRLLEEEALGEILALGAPAQAIKAISRSLKAPVAIRRQGRTLHYTALEVQSLYLEKALRLCARPGTDPEEIRWLGLWEYVLKGLKFLEISQSEMHLINDPGDLKRKIDWVLKLWLLNRSRSKGADERQLKLLDLIYHDLDPASGLYERCQSLGLVDRLVDEERIGQAQCHPPADTRAHLRGLIIQKAFHQNLEILVENWESIQIRTQRRRAGINHPFRNLTTAMNKLGIRLDDPFQGKNPQVLEELERFMEAWS